MYVNTFKATIFVLHFFFFGLTVLLFLLKFHKRDNLKLVMYIIAALWIVFGSTDFILELKDFISMFA